MPTSAPPASTSRVDVSLDRWARSLRSRLGAAADELAPRGKRVRARFAALLGRALGLAETTSDRIALVAELTHLASLLQDDCVDDARSRRGRPTANRRFGSKAGILLGDLAVMRAFQAAADLPEAARQTLQRCLEAMAMGELEEELDRGRWMVDEAKRLRIARQKTGALFAWIATAAAEAAGRPDLARPLGRLGSQVGLAFQIIDDVMDYAPDGAGKDRLQDLRTGRVNHPLLLALKDERHGASTRRETGRLFARFDEARASALALRLERLGYLRRSRHEARRLMGETGTTLGLLPRAKETGELASFLDSLLERRN